MWANCPNRTFLPFLLAIAAQVATAAQDDSAAATVAILLADSSGVFVHHEKTAFLRKAEVVRVIRRSANRVTVQRMDPPPDWETADDSQIELSKTPIEVDATALAYLNEFRKISTWNTSLRRKYTACDGSCDFGVSYVFRSNGSFVAASGTNESETRVSGHLFHHRGIYWAKSSAGKVVASRYNVFYTQGLRSICDMIACGAE